MKKLLFNINSTSWFYGKAKVGKIEMPYTFAILTAILYAFAIGFEAGRGISYGAFANYAGIPFLLFGAQWVLYSAFSSPVSKEIEDAFWKTQLWRFKDPSYDLQLTLYPEAEKRLNELEAKWENEYCMTTDETRLIAPFMQKGWRVVYTGFISIAVFALIGYGIARLIY